MHELAVVLREAEVERSNRRDRSRDSDRAGDARAHLVGHVLGKQRAHGAGAVGELARLRRIEMEIALGVADGAELEARVEAVDDQLGGAAADVEDERTGRRRAAGVDAAHSHRGLFLAAQQSCRKGVAPFDLAEKRLAVLGVAHGARRDEQRALRAERLECAPVVGERVAHARDRHGEEAATRVDPLTEARDARLAVHLVERAVDDVGHEQPRRVRAEVDGSDSHLRG